MPDRDRDQGVNAALASMEKDQAIGERHLAMNVVIFPPMDKLSQT